MQSTDAVPRPPEPAGLKPIDFEELIDRCMGRLDLAQRILSRFSEAAEAEMLALQEALARSDRDAIGQIAHRVAGGALTASAGPLADRCRRLEHEAVAGEPGEFEELVAETLQACRAAMETITSRSAGGN